MDIITHAATGVLLSTAFDEPSAKVACIIGSVIPDISLLPVYYYIHQNQRKGIEMMPFGRSDRPFPEKILVPYRFAHSFLPVIVLLVSGFVTHQPVILSFCLGYFSHILWDIPSHTNQFASRPIYPLSRFKFEGFGDWWKSRRGIGFMLGTWLILFAAFFFVK